MQSYSIQIMPVSPGSQPMEGYNRLKPGTGQFAKTPCGPVEIVVDMTQAQVVGLQGYLERIRFGANTSTVETAITALTPT